MTQDHGVDCGHSRGRQRKGEKMFKASDWRLDNFRVVISGSQLTTTATMKVYNRKLVFSKTAISEMNYPAHIRILISDEADRMVILPYFENDRTAVPFFQETYSEDEGKYIAPKSVAIMDTTLVKGIRKKREWQDSKCRTCYALRFAEMPDALFFDLSTAKIVTREKMRKNAEDAFNRYPPLRLLINDMRPVVLGLPPASNQ